MSEPDMQWLLYRDGRQVCTFEATDEVAAERWVYHNHDPFICTVAHLTWIRADCLEIPAIPSPGAV